MITPIRDAPAADAVSQSSAPKLERPQPQAPQTVKSGAVSQDQVTLKTAGDVDHDGDSK